MEKESRLEKFFKGISILTGIVGESSAKLFGFALLVNYVVNTSSGEGISLSEFALPVLMYSSGECLNYTRNCLTKASTI